LLAGEKRDIFATLDEMRGPRPGWPRGPQPAKRV